MIAIVQTLQVLSGVLWLATAVYLTPRTGRAWRISATRMEALSAPICFVGWLMVGFSVRWAVWPSALDGMGALELITWAALYALSAVLALWFFNGARATRGE